MTAQFNSYKNGVTRCLNPAGMVTQADRYQLTREWYETAGRAGFIAAFELETGIRLNEKRTDARRIELGLPKSPSDATKKVKKNDFYAVHGEWFIKEVDRIFAADSKCRPPKFEPYYHGLMGILSPLLLDSMVLLEDFATWHQGVPGIFGVGKNRLEHNVALFHAGRQAIYGTYSPLSFSDNHADTAISHLRMNIELRFRHGFGVLGLTDSKDGAFVPLSLSRLISTIIQHKKFVTLGCPIEHIDRIYRWANLYIHGGFKLYVWCAPATLEYLRPFLVGGKYTVGSKSGSSTLAGIQATTTAVRNIQDHVLSTLRAELKDPTRYNLETVPPDNCQLIITGP